ncbi:MAG: hypothetical protein HC923_04040, partial [Myxococcales bacterium]|nr:hypothetical protein [Myxococcales bacterium]
MSSSAEGASASLPAPRTVAMVINGKSISEAEVQLRMRGLGRQLVSREAAIAQIIEFELQAQEAEKLGFGDDPSLVEEVEMAVARAAEVRRSQLAKRYRMKALSSMKEASSDEVKKYIEENRERIGQEITVYRVTGSSRAEAEKLLEALEAGTPINALGQSNPTEAGPVGPLGFDTVPESWQEPLGSITPGGRTGIIEMDPTRFVILQLLDRTSIPEPAPEELERRVKAVLQIRAYELER